MGYGGYGDGYGAGDAAGGAVAVSFLMRPARFTASTFSPTDIAGLKQWLDATEESSLWQDSARTTPATADTHRVGAWDDLSGAGVNVVQATAGKRGTLRVPLFAGVLLPGVRFDGDEEVLRGTFGAALAQPNTAFVVCKTSSTTEIQFAMDGATSATTGRHVLGSEATGGAREWAMYAGSFNSSVVGFDTSTAHVLCGVFNGASSLLRLDGTQIKSGDAGAQTLDGLSVGGPNVADDAANLYWAGDIGELLVYDSALSLEDCQSVEAYLKNKWGTP